MTIRTTVKRVNGIYARKISKVKATVFSAGYKSQGQDNIGTSNGLDSKFIIGNGNTISNS
jgi:hypothetical protein